MSFLAAFGHSLRLARAGLVFAREGAFVDVDPALLPPVARLPIIIANLIAKRDVQGLTGLSRAIDRLGPSYVKLGQFLSTRPDIVGPKVALELESLQDRVTPMSRQTAIGIIEAAFGAKVETLFRRFRRTGRRRLDRAGPPCDRPDRRGRKARRGQSAARRGRAAFRA